MSVVTLNASSGNLFNTFNLNGDVVPKVGNSKGIILTIQQGENPSKDNLSRSHTSSIFTCICFSSDGDHLACSDKKGNVYSFSFKQNRYHIVSRIGINVNCMGFSKIRKTELFIGLSNNTIHCYDVETNKRIATLKGHEFVVKSFSFHPNEPKWITCSKDRVLVWDSNQFKRIKTLSSKNASLSQAEFSPSGQFIVTCLRQELFIWNTFTCQFLQKITIPMAENSSGIDHEINVFEISKDGKYLVGGGLSDHIYIWNFENLTFLGVMKINGMNEVTKVRFINTELVAICTPKKLIIVEMSQRKVLLEIYEQTDIIDFDKNNQYLSTVLDNGVINVYSVEALIAQKSKGLHSQDQYVINNNDDIVIETEVDANINSNVLSQNMNRSFPERNLKELTWTDRYRHENGKIQNIDIANIPLNFKTLKKLLFNYGEYPGKYRMLIWRFILCLPENKEAFDILYQRGIHYTQYNLHKRYPITNTTILRKIQRIISALTNLSPVFGTVDYLPELVFPFIKVFGNSVISVFEVVLTFFLNWGKEWFELFPNPPVVILNAIENILLHFDSNLLEHFCNCGVTSNTFVWSVLKNLFTEILTTDQWLKLFDHVFSMPLSFIYFFMVSYLVYFRETFLTMKDKQEFEDFFHSIHPCDINMVIKTAYDLQTKFSIIKHTVNDMLYKYYNEFDSIAKGQQYSAYFIKYPKHSVDFLLKERERILQSEEDIERTKRNIVELTKQSGEYEMEHRNWLLRQNAILDANDRQRKQAWQTENQILQEKDRLKDIEMEQRLNNLAIMENQKYVWENDQNQITEQRANLFNQEIQHRTGKDKLEMKDRLRSANLSHVETLSYVRRGEANVMQKNREMEEWNFSTQTIPNNQNEYTNDRLFTAPNRVVTNDSISSSISSVKNVEPSPLITPSVNQQTSISKREVFIQTEPEEQKKEQVEVTNINQESSSQTIPSSSFTSFTAPSSKVNTSHASNQTPENSPFYGMAKLKEDLQKLSGDIESSVSVPQQSVLLFQSSDSEDFDISKPTLTKVKKEEKKEERKELKKEVKKKKTKEVTKEIPKRKVKRRKSPVTTLSSTKRITVEPEKTKIYNNSSEKVKPIKNKSPIRKTKKSIERREIYAQTDLNVPPSFNSQQVNPKRIIDAFAQTTNSNPLLVNSYIQTSSSLNSSPKTLPPQCLPQQLTSQSFSSQSSEENNSLRSKEKKKDKEDKKIKIDKFSDIHKSIQEEKEKLYKTEDTMQHIENLASYMNYNKSKMDEIVQQHCSTPSSRASSSLSIKSSPAMLDSNGKKMIKEIFEEFLTKKQRQNKSIEIEREIEIPSLVTTTLLSNHSSSNNSSFLNTHVSTSPSNSIASRTSSILQKSKASVLPGTTSTDNNNLTSSSSLLIETIQQKLSLNNSNHSSESSNSSRGSSSTDIEKYISSNGSLSNSPQRKSSNDNSNASKQSSGKALDISISSGTADLLYNYKSSSSPKNTSVETKSNSFNSTLNNSTNGNPSKQTDTITNEKQNTSNNNNEYIDSDSEESGANDNVNHDNSDNDSDTSLSSLLRHSSEFETNIPKYNKEDTVSIATTALFDKSSTNSSNTTNTNNTINSIVHSRGSSPKEKVNIIIEQSSNNTSSLLNETTTNSNEEKKDPFAAIVYTETEGSTNSSPVVDQEFDIHKYDNFNDNMSEKSILSMSLNEAPTDENHLQDENTDRFMEQFGLDLSSTTLPSIADSDLYQDEDHHLNTSLNFSELLSEEDEDFTISTSALLSETDKKL
ncbi:hypothetical protein ABK040_005982 [Willaertia magna]